MNIDTDQVLLQSLHVSHHIWKCFEKYSSYHAEVNSGSSRSMLFLNKAGPSAFIKAAQPLVFKFLMEDEGLSLELKSQTIMMVADMSLGVWDMKINNIRSTLANPECSPHSVNKIVEGFEKNVAFFIEEAKQVCQPLMNNELAPNKKFKP